MIAVTAFTLSFHFKTKSSLIRGVQYDLMRNSKVVDFFGEVSFMHHYYEGRKILNTADWWTCDLARHFQVEIMMRRVRRIAVIYWPAEQTTEAAITNVAAATATVTESRGAGYDAINDVIIMFPSRTVPPTTRLGVLLRGRRTQPRWILMTRVASSWSQMTTAAVDPTLERVTRATYRS